MAKFNLDNYETVEDRLKKHKRPKDRVDLQMQMPGWRTVKHPLLVEL